MKLINIRKAIHFIHFPALVSALIMLSNFGAQAQRDAQISQHMFNRTYYNPAATGASNYVNAFALSRSQWVGWEGAPETQMVSAHSFFPDLNSGFGINLINDQLGYQQNFNGKLMYAYHLKLSDVSYLSMGLGAGLQHHIVNYSLHNPVDPLDPEIPWDNQRKLSPDFDLGFEYNRKRLKLGASVTHLTQRADKDTPFSTGSHFYGYARYDMPVDFKWLLAPSFFFQHSKGSTHFELGTLAHYQRIFWVGSFFRMDDKPSPESVVFMAGGNVLKVLKLGYSFDLNIGQIKGYSQNTHEVFLLLQLPYTNKNYDRTPRFFE